MSCSYQKLSLIPERNYIVNGPHGDPDHREMVRYCSLPAPAGMTPISSPYGVNAGFMGNANGTGTSFAPWAYGVGLAYPIGIKPIDKRTGFKTSSKKYDVPFDVYTKPTEKVVLNYLESEFQPPLSTPEGAKLVQAPQANFTR
jgi:hypothetical protein